MYWYLTICSLKYIISFSLRGLIAHYLESNVSMLKLMNMSKLKRNGIRIGIHFAQVP